MNVIFGKVKGGRIELNAPAEWPDGMCVEIYPTTMSGEKIGLDESEWRDDPEAIADFAEWVKSIEPLEHTEEELREMEEFDRKMSEFNIEAVRKQMETGSFE